MTAAKHTPLELHKERLGARASSLEEYLGGEALCSAHRKEKAADGWQTLTEIFRAPEEST